MGEGAAPVADIVHMAKKYGALVLVDEAHSFGFYGKHGGGICAEQGVTEQVDFIMTTLSKALGSLGGVVAASQEHVDLLKSSSRAYIFQASVSPADMAAALTALRRIATDDGLRERLWDTTRYMRQRFADAGYDLGTGDGPIVTPHFSNKDKLYALVQGMYKRGVQTSAVTYPIVENGRGRLRLICSAAHTKADVDKTLDALIEAEHEVDAQLAAAEVNTNKAAINLADVQQWANAFGGYLKTWLASAPHAVPNLAVAVQLPNKVQCTLEVYEGKVTVGNGIAHTLPTCTLLLQHRTAFNALEAANVQSVLGSICDGTCNLTGQVEAFVWFFARLVERQKGAAAKQHQAAVPGLEAAVY